LARARLASELSLAVATYPVRLFSGFQSRERLFMLSPTDSYRW